MPRGQPGGEWERSSQASAFTRFNRWSHAGAWLAVLEAMNDDVDTEWVILDGPIKGRVLSLRGAGRRNRGSRSASYEGIHGPDLAGEMMPPIPTASFCAFRHRAGQEGTL